MLHRLSDFIDSSCVVRDLPANYWYEGYLQTGELLRLPRNAFVEAIASSLMQQLAQNRPYSREGKMYGVLLVEMPNGEPRVLKAFSGLLNGCSIVEGWVPPIPGRDEVALEEACTLAKLEAIKQELISLKQIHQRQQYEKLRCEFEQQWQNLSDRHKIRKQQRQEKRQIIGENLTGVSLTLAREKLDEQSRLDGIERRQLKRQRDAALQPLSQLIEAADLKMRQLKQQRKELSRQLQAKMHAVYCLTNFSGESLSLKELIAGGSIPTGTGDCCAPKLLHYAATHNLKPLAMAEFWWGIPSANGDKIPGQFYGACAERCQQLMGFLLSGFRPNPPAPFPLREGGEREIFFPIREGGERETFSPITKGKESLDSFFPITKGGERESFSPITEGKESLESPSPDRGGVWGEVSLPIVYEDEWLIAVNKPAGLLSVPGRYYDTQDSLLSRLRNLLPNEIELINVHRLDLETSGILLLARSRQIYRQLSQQFQQRKVHKVYEAIVAGCMTIDRGAIELPLWGDPDQRPYQQVDAERGKFSITHFQAIANEGNYTRVEFFPLTGRTHQLRVHAADPRGLGIPILGDKLYGRRAVASRLHLHARELYFEHPQSGQMLHLQANTPF